MILKTSKQLVEEAMQEIVTLDVDEVKKQLNNNPGALLIDIRDIRELKKTRYCRKFNSYPKRHVGVLVRPR